MCGFRDLPFLRSDDGRCHAGRERVRETVEVCGEGSWWRAGGDSVRMCNNQNSDLEQEVGKLVFTFYVL